MSPSRRKFLTQTSLGVLGAAVAAKSEAQDPTQLPPGAPSAFGAGPAIGPEVSPVTFAEAEKLAQITLAPAHRTQAANSWRVDIRNMPSSYRFALHSSVTGTTTPPVRVQKW